MAETVEKPTTADRIQMFRKIAGDALLRGIPGATSGMYAAQAILALQKRLKETDFDGELMPIDPSEASELKFMIGHPRKKILYVLHPADAAVYIPVAQFHALLFEHKVAEALRLIRCLGAKTIDVIRVEGWDQSSGFQAGLKIPTAEQLDISASTGVTRGAERSIISKMKLKPSGNPHIPGDMVWLPHEPLWKEVAEARLNSGLTSFVLDVRSTDDYGINAGLKAQIVKAGLDAGGSFVEHRSTIWRLEGTFA